MLQYKIPQNVGIEDKIVGPFSLRQLIIVFAGLGISYVLFAILGKMYELNILEYIIIAIPAILAMAIALVKINGLTLFKFTLITIEFAIKPKRRVWDHRGILNIVAPTLFNTHNKSTEKKEKKDTGEKDKKNMSLDQLSQILDSGGFEHMKTEDHQDIDESKDENLVLEAFLGANKTEDEKRYWKDKTARERVLVKLAKMPRTEIKKLKEMKETIAQINKEQSNIKKVEKPQRIEIKQKIVVEKKPEQYTKPIQPTKLSTEGEDTNPRKKEGEVKPTPMVKPIIKQVEEPAPKPAVQSEVLPSKKKRRRRKPKKNKPIRTNTEINTTERKQPVQVSKETKTNIINKKPTPQEPIKPRDKTSGEFELKELEQGEIEINLE